MGESLDRNPQDPRVRPANHTQARRQPEGRGCAAARGWGAGLHMDTRQRSATRTPAQKAIPRLIFEREHAAKPTACRNASAVAHCASSRGHSPTNPIGCQNHCVRKPCGLPKHPCLDARGHNLDAAIRTQAHGFPLVVSATNDLRRETPEPIRSWQWRKAGRQFAWQGQGIEMGVLADALEEASATATLRSTYRRRSIV